MKAKNARNLSFQAPQLFIALAGLVMSLSNTAQAVTLTKANTTTLNLATDWNAGAGTVPTVADTATWQASPISAANNIAMTLGGDITCLGMDIRVPASAAAASLKIGSGSILNLSTGGVNQSNGGVDSMFNSTINLIGNALPSCLRRGGSRFGRRGGTGN